MPRDKNFKRRVRARMSVTGERYSKSGRGPGIRTRGLTVPNRTEAVPAGASGSSSVPARIRISYQRSLVVLAHARSFLDSGRARLVHYPPGELVAGAFLPRLQLGL